LKQALLKWLRIVTYQLRLPIVATIFATGRQRCPGAAASRFRHTLFPDVP
jgi:hypothetical protein